MTLASLGDDVCVETLTWHRTTVSMFIKARPPSETSLYVSFGVYVSVGGRHAYSGDAANEALVL